MKSPLLGALFSSRSLAALILIFTSSTPSLAARIEGLGDLPGGIRASQASAVSADGSTVVGASSSERSYNTVDLQGRPIHALEAFLWTQQEGLIPLGDLPGDPTFASTATGVSDDGQVVVGSSPSGLSNSEGVMLPGTEGFYWTRQGGMNGIGVIENGMQKTSPVLAVSGDGSRLTGYVSDGNSYKAFLWDIGSGDGFQLLSDTFTGASWNWSESISSVGTRSVGRAGLIRDPDRNAMCVAPAYWTSDRGFQFESLFQTPTCGQASAISRNGKFAAGVAQIEHSNQAFVMDIDTRTFITLPTPAGGRWMIRAVSDDGGMVIGEVIFRNYSRAFTWSAQFGTEPLSDYFRRRGVPGLERWELLAATGISSDGRVIVGYGLRFVDAAPRPAATPKVSLEAWRVEL